MAPLKLTLAYRDAADLAAHLEQLRTQGALLVPLPDEVGELDQFQEVELQVELPEGGGQLTARVLQVLPELGLTLELGDPVTAFGLARGAEPAPEPQPPDVSVEGDDEEHKRAPRMPAGSSPISWPIEKLQAEWHDLPLPDRIRVARYGKRPARIHVLRQQDSQLLHFLLSNPHISAEEVAQLSSMGNLEPALLKRLINSAEWTRHTQVARNLLCHPKATLPQVTRLMDKLPDDELRRLSRTGKVRSSVKRLIIKRLERRGGRR